MPKESVTAQDVCDLLNELLNIDYDCIHALINHRVRCNEKVADHPSVQVQQFIDDEFPKVGLLGILNGLFGLASDGAGVLCYEHEIDGRITKFKIRKDA